ncbi:MAG: hypothetical protein HQ553_08040 [Chloroflexi bacterium]|nr:hypothetical protein [Chloroflexota bacterium]
MKKLDVFIQGETMDLCIPTEEFSRESKWYSWFNQAIITKYLEQGIFPNTSEGQVEFYRSQKSTRLMLIISNKKEYMGTVSLSAIDLAKKACSVAIVVDRAVDRQMSPFISLEAMARITEHAFNGIGLNRIEAGQHIELGGWQQRLELIGYKLEGLHINKFVKGHSIDNSVSIACLYEDFQKIVGHRGCLWDSIENMETRYKELPKKRFVNIMSDFFQSEREDYYEKIFLL